jgi:serine/threonine-protein kinase HipA
VKRCPITYAEIPPEARYSREGLQRLSRRLKRLEDLPYSAEEQRQEAIARAAKMSIQGVQPKLSAQLNDAQGRFDVVDTGGTYILKPQSQFTQVPENEDLTMRLAASAGVDVPLHGLIYSKDGTLSYFIKRFDRADNDKKLAVEDFAQLSGDTRDTKYDSSMERVAAVIDKFCTFPAVEKRELFRRTLVSFLVGNEDMHLKNFSLLRANGMIGLSPAYDLVNTTIAIGGVTEELALPIDGRKRNLRRSDFVEYYGLERLKLTRMVIDDILVRLASCREEWERLIAQSFVSGELKSKYRDLIAERRVTFELR